MHKSNWRISVAQAVFALALAAALPGCGWAQPPSAADQNYMWRASAGETNERDPKAEPLYRAIIENDSSEVARLLKEGVSPNALLSENQWSPLMVAAALANETIVSSLLAHGANPNYLSDDRVEGTPLAVALHYNIPLQDFSIFHLLLDKGADINGAYDDGQEDVAHSAAVLGQMDIVNELLARGYNRDLAGLAEILQVRRVDEQTEPQKQKAIHTVKALLRN